MSELDPDILKAHDEACQKGLKSYLDPVYDCEIFTELYLRNRGFCCNQCCRHCPYGAPDTMSINMKAFSDNFDKKPPAS